MSLDKVIASGFSPAVHEKYLEHAVKAAKWRYKRYGMSTQGNENREIDGAVYLGNDPQELERIAMLKKTRNKGMVGIPQTEIVHPEPSQSLER